MKNILKALCLSISGIFNYTIKAFIMDVWELRGVTGEEVSEAILLLRKSNGRWCKIHCI